LASLVAPLMFAGLHNHFPLLTIVSQNGICLGYGQVQLLAPKVTIDSTQYDEYMIIFLYLERNKVLNSSYGYGMG